MMTRNSLRQLWRIPIKTALFFLLLTFSTMMVCIGGNLWSICAQNMERFEDIFSTIGTVEQMPEKIEQKKVWSAETKDYMYGNRKVYGESVPLSVLDFPDAGYLSGPEHRAFYNAYVPELKIIDDTAGRSNYIVAEASPVEDCIPDGPVKMEVKNVLFSYYPLNTQYFYYCDHNNEHPEKMFADQTYIMDLGESAPHNWQMDNTSPHEYVPLQGPASSQAAADGTRLPTALPGNPVEVIGTDFYAAGYDQMWQALAREREMMFHTIPVTATENIGLMMPFYAGDAYVADGNEFTKEDYDNGNKVCLISWKFARRNQLSVGDKLPLSLRLANYAQSANVGWWGGYGPLNTAGENYFPFEESDYIIQGIYQLSPGASKDRSYRLQENEVIIPRASIKNSDANHIAVHGPMKGYTTSFQIPNGSIDRYLEEWAKQGIDNLEFHFYDKGYSYLESGLKNMKKMAYILLLAGIITALLIVIFFSNMFITRQKKRTAIERSLGAGRKQCIYSLLIGIVLIAGLGSIAGSAAGYFLTGKVAEGMGNIVHYDTTYSNGLLGIKTSQEGEDVSIDTTAVSMAVTVLAGSGVLLLTIGISLAGIHRNLKNEPLILLSSKDE